MMVRSLFLQDGDIIHYSIPRKEITVEVSEREMETRTKPTPPHRPFIKGFLGKLYPFLVGSVDRGAVLELPTQGKK